MPEALTTWQCRKCGGENFDLLQNENDGHVQVRCLACYNVRRYYEPSTVLSDLLLAFVEKREA